MENPMEYVFIPENTQSELYVSIGILYLGRPYGKPYGITSLFPENTQCELYIFIGILSLCPPYSRPMESHVENS